MSAANWRTRRGTWIASCCLVLVIPMVVFAGVGTPISHAVLRGGLVGFAFLIGVFAAAELLAPATFLRWRSWMVEGAPRVARTVGAAFDKGLGSGGDSYVESRLAQRRVRLFGVSLLVVGALVTYLVWRVLALMGQT